VYVDGVRIPIIYHLTGTTSVLSPDLIEAVDYLPGGYGVHYGRSMGGVIDIRTKTKFDEDKIVWGTDILDSQIYFEGKVGKNKKQGIAVGARRSYIDALLPLFVPDDFVIKPRYWDYQVKWSPDTAPDRKLSAFVYGLNDVLSIGTPDDYAQGSDQDTQGDLLTEYGTHRAVVQFEQKLGPRLDLRMTPSLGIDTALFGVGDEFTIENGMFIGELRTEMPWKPIDAVEIVPGMDFIGGTWWFSFRSPFQWTDLEDPLAEREAISIDGKGTSWTPDFFLKANLRPLKERERLLLQPGVRLDLLTSIYQGSITGTEDAEASRYLLWDVEPRFLSRFAVTDSFWLKGGTGI
jgi:outer membrane receptor protein involved in Fe transport